MKTKITKHDGTVIELDGDAADIAEAVRELHVGTPVVNPVPLIPWEEPAVAPNWPTTPIVWGISTTTTSPGLPE